MMRLFDCSNESDELRAKALKEVEIKERIEEKLNATNNELGLVKKERDDIKNERDTLKKELEQFVNYPEKFAELTTLVKLGNDKIQQLMKTQNNEKGGISPLAATTTEVSDQQQRINDLETQLAYSEMQVKDKDIIIGELTELKEKLNDVERELRQTKSNDLCVDANALRLEQELTEKRKELASTQKALVSDPLCCRVDLYHFCSFLLITNNPLSS